MHMYNADDSLSIEQNNLEKHSARREEMIKKQESDRIYYDVSHL